MPSLCMAATQTPEQSSDVRSAVSRRFSRAGRLCAGSDPRVLSAAPVLFASGWFECAPTSVRACPGRAAGPASAKVMVSIEGGHSAT